jgi:nucleoid DNA-binding protein
VFENGSWDGNTHDVLKKVRDIIVSGKRDEIRIPKLGTFKIVPVKARQFRNPKTGEPVSKEAGFTIRFKPFKSAVRDLNNNMKGEIP